MQSHHFGERQVHQVTIKNFGGTDAESLCRTQRVFSNVASGHFHIFKTFLIDSYATVLVYIYVPLASLVLYKLVFPCKIFYYQTR